MIFMIKLINKIKVEQTHINIHREGKSPRRELKQTEREKNSKRERE